MRTDPDQNKPDPRIKRFSNLKGDYLSTDCSGGVAARPCPHGPPALIGVTFWKQQGI